MTSREELLYEYALSIDAFVRAAHERACQDSAVSMDALARAASERASQDSAVSMQHLHFRMQCLEYTMACVQQSVEVNTQLQHSRFSDLEHRMLQRAKPVMVAMQKKLESIKRQQDTHAKSLQRLENTLRRVIESQNTCWQTMLNLKYVSQWRPTSPVHDSSSQTDRCQSRDCYNFEFALRRSPQKALRRSVSAPSLASGYHYPESRALRESQSFEAVLKVHEITHDGSATIHRLLGNLPTEYEEIVKRMQRALCIDANTWEMCTMKYVDDENDWCILTPDTFHDFQMQVVGWEWGIKLYRLWLYNSFSKDTNTPSPRTLG